jgi:cholesterol transport system auxiliary component
MTMLLTPKATLAPLLLLALLSGCIQLERPGPERDTYALRPAAPEPRLEPSGPVLDLRSLRISPLFDQRTFVYRIGEDEYRSDYYHLFLVDPGAMITDAIARRLRGTGLFRQVTVDGGLGEPDYLLTGEVDELYGDDRPAHPPEAVLALELRLAAVAEGGLRPVFSHRYRRTIPLGGRSAEALVGGWNRALEEILADLAGDLKAVLAGAKSANSRQEVAFVALP